MKIKKIYQTLEDRDNPDYIEENAPFKCNWKNAWLGEGYYFWDTFIENAHWWGEIRYQRHNSSYVICEGTCHFDTNQCFDLVGDTEHMIEFSEAIEFLKSKKLVNNETTVARILSFIKSKIKGFKYKAIRVYGINTISEHREKNNKFVFRLIFEHSKHQYLDYKPAIQICIFNKGTMGLSKMQIVYPDEYIMDYLI